MAVPGGKKCGKSTQIVKNHLQENNRPVKRNLVEAQGGGVREISRKPVSEKQISHESKEINKPAENNQIETKERVKRTLVGAWGGGRGTNQE